MSNEARLYFEGHITTEAGEDWDVFVRVAEDNDWKVSKFDVDDVDSYHGKWFLSARDNFLDSMKERIRQMNTHLKENGIDVIRYKIEDTVLDSKYGDILI